MAFSKGNFDRRENRRNAAARKGRDGSSELIPEAEVGYPLTSLDEIRIKRPSLEPLRGRFKAIAVNLHGIAPFFVVDGCKREW